MEVRGQIHGLPIYLAKKFVREERRLGWLQTTFWAQAFVEENVSTASCQKST
jgi:hypothetical protein